MERLNFTITHIFEFQRELQQNLKNEITILKLHFKSLWLPFSHKFQSQHTHAQKNSLNLEILRKSTRKRLWRLQPQKFFEVSCATSIFRRRSLRTHTRACLVQNWNAARRQSSRVSTPWNAFLPSAKMYIYVQAIYEGARQNTSSSSSSSSCHFR